MINNSDDISKYTDLNKIYIPVDKVNSNYSYRFNGDYIMIITNQNCYTNYTTQYCDCYQYNYKNNVMSDTLTCNTSSNNAVIPFSSISSDINYSQYIRNNFIQDKGTIIFMVILGLLFAIFLTKERSSY